MITELLRAMSTADESVSDFIIKTCRFDTEPNIKKLIEWRSTTADDSVALVGSVSELYVETMLLCICDVNLLKANKSMIAVPSQQLVPQRLTSTFADNVTVYEIADIDRSRGEFSLLEIGKLVKRSDEDEHVFVSSSLSATDGFFGEGSREPETVECEDVHLCGSDRNLIADYRLSPMFSRQLTYNTVHSVRCLSWPTQAAEWPERVRKNNWPQPSIIRSVVCAGCDMVRITHDPQRLNENEKGHTWRFSFSRAETILLNTWTPVQQIVYHMMRYVLHKGVQGGETATTDGAR
jgi:hypothetical protein